MKPEASEDRKHVMFVKNTSTSEQISMLMRDLSALCKPNCTVLNQRFSLHPFDNADEVEYLSRKYEASLFLIGAHSKKRPHHLTLVRMFDYMVLDMIELESSNYFPSEVFEFKAATGHKPALMFIGQAFYANERYIQAANLLTDIFRGKVVTTLDLMGLEHVIVFTATENEGLAMRVYKIELKPASDSKLPFVELKDMGPFADFKIGRVRYAEDRRAALQRPKETISKKEKNVEFNPLGDKLGRIHMQKQDLGKLQTRKVKALKKLLDKKEMMLTKEE